MTFRNRWRKTLNNVMLSLTGVCAVVAVSALFLILGYLGLQWLAIGGLELFHQAADTARRGRRRHGQRDRRQPGDRSAWPRSSGLPVGFLAGIYLAEFGGKTFAFLIRYTADLLNGVPSIVIGIFAWTVVVVPMHISPPLAGGFALSLMLIPITAAQHRAVPEHRAADLARRRAGAGRQQMEDHCHGGGARRLPRHRHRHDSGRGARRRRNRAAAVHQPEQPVLEQQRDPAHRLAAGA